MEMAMISELGTEARLERYFDIVDPMSLQSLESMSGIDHAVALTAAYCGNVRLIDNLDLYR